MVTCIILWLLNKPRESYEKKSYNKKLDGYWGWNSIRPLESLQSVAGGFSIANLHLLVRKFGAKGRQDHFL